jgi:hypothetical protein
MHFLMYAVKLKCCAPHVHAHAVETCTSATRRALPCKGPGLRMPCGACRSWPRVRGAMLPFVGKTNRSAVVLALQH